MAPTTSRADGPSALASGYTTAEVTVMLDLAPARIRAFVRAGLVGAARGPAGEVRFSFQDLVLLRAARGLLDARIPPRRVERALASLATQLPGRSLSGVRIVADGSRVVVRDGGAAWQPESGQTLLDFDVDELAARARPLAAAPPPAAGTTPRETAFDGERPAAALFDEACDLESADPEAALAAYREAVARAPGHADAHLNLGRLLHERGELAAAERHYRLALAARPSDATAAFDLGVALEDQGRLEAAGEAYAQALDADPAHADAHYNLALVCERRGERQAALRHLMEYRRLVRG